MNNLQNSVRLTGRLGGQPEMQLTAGNKRYAKVSLATNFFRKNGKGETVRETHWHQLVLWNKPLEVAEKYLGKGKLVAIEGRLANRFYTDRAGAKHHVTEIIVNELMLLEPREAAQ